MVRRGVYVLLILLFIPLAAAQTNWLGESGSCPASECFVANTGKTGDFAKGTPQCVKSGTKIFSYECLSGEWNSRLPDLINELTKDVSSDYSLHCASPREIFPRFDNKEGAIIGATLLNGELACYKLDKEGQRLIPQKDNTCIVRACILTQGSKKVAAFMLTDDAKEKTVLQTFNVNPSSCKGATYKNCGKGIMYSPTKNVLIVSQQPKNIVSIVGSAWNNFFSNKKNIPAQLLPTSKLITQYYASSKGNKQIEAIYSNTAAIRFENYDTPICSFVKQFKSSNPSSLGKSSQNAQLGCNRQKNVVLVSLPSTFRDTWSEFIR